MVDVPAGKRSDLEQVLEESFDGWYLHHSKGTLREVEVVRAAVLSGSPVGLVMLKPLGRDAGYVYYIAVARAHRKKGVARLLLDDALRHFREAGMKEVFAGVEEDNAPSEALFRSAGFTRTSFHDVSRSYGRFSALNMYRVMRIVPGEFLLHRGLA